MTVDLSSGCMGIIGITWSGGVSRYYCPSVTAEPDGTFTVRIESGVYWEYLKDGTCGAALDLTMDELAHPAVALIRDIPGYQIRPHPDSKHKLATVQVFLPSHTRAPHIGTRFYRKDGDAFTETAAVPYLPGQGYFFRRTDNSWHGVEPTTQQDGVRDSLMLIYFDSPKAGFS